MFHDVHVFVDLPDSTALRADAALLILPDSAAFCGLTAARLYGLPVPDDDERLHVAVPSWTPTIPRIKELVVHSYSIPIEQIRKRDGRWLVAPERLFLELAATLPRIELIVAGDQMLRRDLTTPDALDAFLRRCRRRRGVRKARTAVPMLERNTDSPPESRLRMLLVDAGLPRPVANRDVFHDTIPGLRLARPDLSYPELKIAIQYEGRHHQEDSRQYAYDIERDGHLIDRQWIVIRVNKDGLFRYPGIVVERVRRAIAQRRLAVPR